MDTKPANQNYENITSGAIISGTVYTKLKKKMKAKYRKVATIEKKKAATPPEAAK